MAVLLLVLAACESGYDCECTNAAADAPAECDGTFVATATLQDAVSQMQDECCTPDDASCTCSCSPSSE